jgi:hypothetical protein
MLVGGVWPRSEASYRLAARNRDNLAVTFVGGDIEHFVRIGAHERTQALVRVPAGAQTQMSAGNSMPRHLGLPTASAIS